MWYLRQYYCPLEGAGEWLESGVMNDMAGALLHEFYGENAYKPNYSMYVIMDHCVYRFVHGDGLK